MNIAIRCLPLILLGLSVAQAQFNAQIEILNAGPSTVAPQGRLDLKLRLTNLSSATWEPLPAIWDCAFLSSMLVDVYAACPAYPSPAVGSNYGKVSLILEGFSMDKPNPFATSAGWWALLPMPASIGPGESMVTSVSVAAPAEPGRYVVAPQISMFGCCNFTTRILNNELDGYNLSPHFEFQVAADTRPPALLISGLLAGACSLWPPNNKLVEVGKIVATDDTNAVARLEVSVTSGDPSFTPADVEVTSPSPAQRNVRLRSARSGTQTTGRIYQLAILAADSVGNQNTTQITCLVPHDQGK